MMKQMIVLGLALILFGCLSQPYSGGQQGPAAPGTQAPSGQGASGTPQQNATPPANNTPPATTTPPANTTVPQQNVTPAPTQPPQPSEQTLLSAADLLKQGLDKLPYPSGGPYSVRTFQWVVREFDSDSINIAINPTMQVLFDNKSENNLVAFGFTTYAPQSGANITTANGVIIVYNTSTMIDSSTAKGLDMVIDYNVPGMERSLRGTSVTKKETMLNIMNRTISVYTFESDNVK